MHLDQPPIGIGIVIACRLPDHAQPIGKSHQPDDRRFVGIAVAPTDQPLRLSGLDRQPHLPAERTGPGIDARVFRVGSVRCSGSDLPEFMWHILHPGELTIPHQSMSECRPTRFIRCTIRRG